MDGLQPGVELVGSLVDGAAPGSCATCGGVELVGSLQPLVVPPSRLVVPSSASLPSYPLSTIIIMITIIIFMIME